jgi:hypothetical protein
MILQPPPGCISIPVARDRNGDLGLSATGLGRVLYHDWQLSRDGATG